MVRLLISSRLAPNVFPSQGAGERIGLFVATVSLRALGGAPTQPDSLALPYLGLSRGGTRAFTSERRSASSTWFSLTLSLKAINLVAKAFEFASVAVIVLEKIDERPYSQGSENPGREIIPLVQADAKRLVDGFRCNIDDAKQHSVGDQHPEHGH